MRKKIFLVLIMIFIYGLFAHPLQAAITIYRRTGLTGGTSADLDGINGSGLVEGDVGWVFRDANTVETKYEYRLKAASGAAESVPDIIAPDTNPGSKRWILQAIYNATLAGLTSSVAELNILDGVTATEAEIDAACDGSTAKNSHTHITTEISKVTADPNEVNILDGCTATTAQINAAASGKYGTRGAILGDTTAGRVIRNVLITLAGHTDPNIIEIYLRNDGTFNFNGDTVAAEHISKNQTLTNYKFDSDGTAIYVMDAAISGTIVGILAASVIYDSSDLTYTTLYVDINSNNIKIKFYSQNTAIDIGQIGNAKAVHLSVTYLTSG